MIKKPMYVTPSVEFVDVRFEQNIMSDVPSATIKETDEDDWTFEEDV